MMRQVEIRSCSPAQAISSAVEHCCGLRLRLPSIARSYPSRSKAPYGHRGCGEQGAAMVEMALSMVILLAMVFGIIQTCLALYTYHYISEAAREGTRFAIVRGSACNSPGYQCNASESQIQTFVKGLGYPGIDPSAMTVTTSWSAYPPGGTCSPSASCNNPGNLVTVNVRYDFHLSIPFVPSSTLHLSSTSAMVISQ